MQEAKNLLMMNIKEKDSRADDSADSGDVKYKKIGSTTYEVVSNYIGKNSLPDIVKSAIKRDVESGKY